MERAICLAVVAIGLIAITPKSASAAVIKYECVYSKEYSATENRLSDAEDFTMQFMVDTVTKKAFFVGNLGVEEVSLVEGFEGITFLETLPTGVVQTTTVSKSGRSIHSRHTIIAGEFVPSQSYGECKQTPSR